MFIESKTSSNHKSNEIFYKIVIRNHSQICRKYINYIQGVSGITDFFVKSGSKVKINEIYLNIHISKSLSFRRYWDKRF